MREKHVQKKGIVLMFISTQTLWNSECWKNVALSSLDFHVTFVWFSSCLLKIHSLSPSLYPSLYPSPYTYQASSEFCLCLISHSVQISLVHSCGFKTFIWYLLPSFYFQLLSLYCHVYSSEWKVSLLDALPK